MTEMVVSPDLQIFVCMNICVCFSIELMTEMVGTCDICVCFSIEFHISPDLHVIFVYVL